MSCFENNMTALGFVVVVDIIIIVVVGGGGLCGGCSCRWCRSCGGV